jgi:hypothetical protein
MAIFVQTLHLIEALLPCRIYVCTLLETMFYNTSENYRPTFPGVDNNKDDLGGNKLYHAHPHRGPPPRMAPISISRLAATVYPVKLY